MKYVYFWAAVLVVGLTATVAFTKSNSPDSGTPTKLEFQNHTVSGNITSERKTDAQHDLVTTNKTVLKLKLDNTRVIVLTGLIDSESIAVATKKLKALQQDSNKRILLAIDSPGGSVIDGAALISEMEASNAPVDTVCLRLCASMAAMIHSYGKQRYSLDRAILMYHPASGGLQGQIPNMLSALKTINRYTAKMFSNVVKRSKMSKDEFDSLVAYELWIDAEDSLDKGFIDSIVNLENGLPEQEQQEVPPPQESGGNKEGPLFPRKTFKIEMIAPFNL